MADVHWTGVEHDCSGNPNYPLMNASELAAISVAGRIGGASGPRVDAGDFLFCVSSNSGGTHAAVGSNFRIWQGNVVNPVGCSTTTPASGEFAQFVDGTGRVIGGGYHPVGTLDTDGTSLPTGAALTGVWVNRGEINCSANPNYPAAVNGDTYCVSAAGKIGGASGSTVEVGDWAVCIADNGGGTQASVGTSWRRLQVNVVTPVNGPTAATTAGAFACFTDTTGKNIYQGFTAETSELTGDGSAIPTCAVVYAAINALREELT